MITKAPSSDCRRHSLPPAELSPAGGFVTIDGERYAVINDVDAMAPFLMSIVSDSDVWLFVASNGAFTAGRAEPTTGCSRARRWTRRRDTNASGARSAFLVRRGGPTTLWEPWHDLPATRAIRATCTSGSTAPPSSSRRSTSG